MKKASKVDVVIVVVVAVVVGNDKLDNECKECSSHSITPRCVADGFRPGSMADLDAIVRGARRLTGDCHCTRSQSEQTVLHHFLDSQKMFFDGSKLETNNKCTLSLGRTAKGAKGQKAHTGLVLIWVSNLS